MDSAVTLNKTKREFLKITRLNGHRCCVRASRTVTGPDLGVSKAVNKPHTSFS